MTDNWQGDKPPQKNTLIDSLIPGIDSVLGIRDAIGAKIRDVYIVTRTWDGDTIGTGDFTEDIQQISPSPRIVDYSHNIYLHEAGAVRSGDLIIRSISKLDYPTEADVDCRTDQDTKNVEKFYFINNMAYTVIKVRDRHVTWDVQIRKRTDENSKVASTT